MTQSNPPRDQERIERILVKFRAALEAHPEVDITRVITYAIRSKMWRRFAHLSRHLNDPKGVMMDESLLGYMLAFDDIAFEKELDEWMANPKTVSHLSERM